MKKDALNILTIGNSFTDSLVKYFPEVVKSAGCKLHFDRANFGGCELERHWSYIEAEEHSPVCRIYRGGIKLRDILAQKPWDVVTIQQASHASWRPETFQPYAKNIFDFVRKQAPAAEVVIQQTWAYRNDHPQFLPGSEWGITQISMYENLTKNYRTLAKTLGGLRIIPTGLAVQLSRQAEKKPFVNYSPDLIKKLAWPDLPPQAGDVVGQCGWCKNEAGELFLNRDLIHLNERGQYLQACVWFGYLYGRKVSAVKFNPVELSDADAAKLRKIAQQAIDTFEQVK